MNVPRVSVTALLLGAGVVGCATAGTRESASGPKMENLLRASLAEEFTPGREVIVSLVEIPPHTTMERHWHPGEEFHYYLEGEVEIRIEGSATIVGKPGGVGHIPYKRMHTAITGERGAKALVFRVHTEGEPVRHLEGGDTSDR